MKKTQFVNPMAVLVGLVLAGIMTLNSNPVYADEPGGRKAPVTQKCGNGIKEGTEECDDGNVVAGDGCSACCEIEVIAPPAGPMKVEKLDAGTVQTGRIDAGHVEVGTMNVGDQNVGSSRVAKMEVESIEVTGTKPVHSFSLLFGFGSGFSDEGPYTLLGRARYDAQWGIVGFSIKAGGGGIGSYEGYRVGALSLEPALLLGNSRGWAELGCELMPSAPFRKGHEWENTVAVKLGGFIRVPEQESNAAIFLPWLKIVVYEPKDPFFPAYNPLVMIGLDIGWEHLWFPTP